MDYHLSSEERIILSLSRLHPSKDALEEIRNMLSSVGPPLDYKRIIRLAARNGVAPLVYCNLRNLSVVPDNVMRELKNIYIFTTAGNLLNVRAMVRILTLLKKEEIEAIPLKGSLAAEIVFSDLGLYPSGDIDILIQPSDLHRAGKVLTDEGYSKEMEIGEKDLLSSHYHMIYHDSRHLVEVHWNLVKRYFDIPPDFWWEDTVLTEYEGIEITMLSIERYIIYTVFRLYDHGFRPLKFFVLIAEIINKYQKEIDWHKLLDCSRRYRMGRLMSFTLKLLDDMLGTEIPDSIVNGRVYGYGIFKGIVISGLFEEVKRPHMRMLIYTLLQETPLDTLKILLRRLFPDGGEIRLRYGLPEKSKKVYIYYFLNPFLMFLKRKA